MSESKKLTKESSSKLRACLNCSIIKPTSFFKEKGCPNCPFLRIKNTHSLYAITSLSFKGLIVLKDSKKSWVGKWQRIDNYVPGNYALTVEGDLKDNYIDDIEQEGRVYINRSTSFSIS